MAQNKSNDGHYTIDSFFGGVGGIDLGFKQTKRFRTIYINEFDTNALKTLKANWQCQIDGRDIHKVEASEVPDCDVMVGGFPCQAFSIAGYRKGFEDSRGELFFEMLRMIKAYRPKAILMENVKNLVSHDNGNTFMVIRNALALNGYFIKWRVLNAKNYGNIPQNRERIYIVGFRDKSAFNDFTFPEAMPLKVRPSDLIDYDSKIDDKYYYLPGRQKFYDQLAEVVKDKDKIYQWRRHYVRENKSGVVPTLTANMGTGGHNVPIILTDNGIRKLTPRETFNVMGFPKDYNLPDIADGQLYKQAGNSVVVPVIQRIAKQMAAALDCTTKSNKQSNDKGGDCLIYSKTHGLSDGESYVICASEVGDLPVLGNAAALKVMHRNSVQEFCVKAEQ